MESGREAGKEASRDAGSEAGSGIREEVATLSDCHNVVGPSNKSRLKNGRT